MRDMKGARIIEVGKLVKVIEKKFCCRKCAVASHQKYMRDFLHYCDEYEKNK